MARVVEGSCRYVVMKIVEGSSLRFYIRQIEANNGFKYSRSRRAVENDTKIFLESLCLDM